MRCFSTLALSRCASVCFLVSLILLFLDHAESAQNNSNRQQRRANLGTFRTQPASISTVDSPLDGYSHKPSAGLTEQRLLQDFKLADFLLVATVDGSLYACERDTGLERWNLRGEESVVKVSPKDQSRDQKSDDNDLTWIVEPLGDGALYYFTLDSGLQKLPISIRELVSQSPFKADDKYYTGSRQTTLYSVNARTGRVVNVYGFGSGPGLCRRKSLDEFDEDDWNEAIGDHETFMVGRTEYRLQIHSKSGVVWNVSYSTWGPNNMDTDLIDQHTSSLDDLYVVALHDGVIVGADQYNETRRWARVLPSPAIATFDVLSSFDDFDRPNDQLIVLPQPKLHDTNIESGTESISAFVNRTSDGGWYALSAQHHPYLVKNAPPALWNLGVFSLASNDHGQSLIGVHDGKRLRDTPLLAGIDPPTERKLIGSGYSPMATSGILAALSMHAVVDIGFVMLLLVLGYFILKIRPLRELLSSKLALPNDHQVEKLDAHANETSPQSEIVDIVEVQKRPETTDPVLGQSVKETVDDTPGVNNSDKDNAQTPVKKRKRGTRGGRRNGNGGGNKDADREIKSIIVVDDHTRAKEPEDPRVSLKNENALESEDIDTESGSSYKINSLEVTEVVLGYGSHGTVVYKGTFENREVAVKRMLLDFYDVASHEVSLLQESDDHPNVVRYFCKQESQKFLYIALELCPATLQDVIERSSDFASLVSRMDPPKVLYQIANGLQYLHSLKIVHRDIKPQNILVAAAKQLSHGDNLGTTRVLISDFGLCKKLEGDQSSFRATTAHAAGTSGWRAPELLTDYDESSNGNGSSSHTLAPNCPNTGSTSEPAVIDTLSNRRATRAIDIFSLGCVFYYVLSNGSHPFGDRYMREANIIRGDYSLDYLEALGYQGIEARDLIERMLDRDPRKRPTANDVLLHPYFWSMEKRLNFLLEVSDRFEIEQRDPPSELLEELESDPERVVYNDWYKRLDRSLIENLGKYRKYHTDKVLDLLRALRNKKHHYQDLPPNVQTALGSVPDGFLAYFSQRFPNLLMHVYYVVKNNIQDEPHFRPYFTVATV
ncbi:hypothetical protein V1525DRAFT_404697 [Lipomyces kononenkoae]|uniref:Uncharacterized protein n=1 Tax=Lipomyces kononenkoae TaxID=34357 RepID=A0ACC3SZS7_LIPKO